MRRLHHDREMSDRVQTVVSFLPTSHNAGLIQVDELLLKVVLPGIERVVALQMIIQRFQQDGLQDCHGVGGCRGASRTTLNKQRVVAR